MQQDNLAAACCVDDVMFAALALNVGWTDVFNLECIKTYLNMPVLCFL